jgi:superfamily II DNA or RNA helicase
MDVASNAAALEGFVVDAYLDQQEFGKATINLVSQASCLLRAERFAEARRVLLKAMKFADAKKIREWITEELVKLDEQPDPGFVFDFVKTRIPGNPSLRRPQIEAYEAAQKHFSTSNEHAIIQLPVGCGKSGVMSILPFRIAKGRVLVVAPNIEIKGNLVQTLDYSRHDSFLRMRQVLSNGRGPAAAQLDSSANLFDCDKSDIVVANIQQLAAADSKKWLAKLSPDYFDMVLIDEGHHNVAPTWKSVINRFRKAKITSFTATPLRADGQKVEGTRIYRFPIAAAIRDGYIKDIASRKLEPMEIRFTFKGEENHHTLEEIVRLREETWFSKGIALAPECNRHIVDASIQCLRELRNGSKIRHQIIASACSIDHARSIRALYEERHLQAAVIHSELKKEEQEKVKEELRSGRLDVIVHVQMLGEGADYPTLSIAAIFRPYRHLVPYVQFVGRVMRVVHENSPGHPDNRGFVVSHVGLNIDRWWAELKDLDGDDQLFFEEIANGERSFLEGGTDDHERRRFTPDMQVIEETISHFVQERFLPEDTKAQVDDLIKAMAMRGIDFDQLGLSREDLEKRLLLAQKTAIAKGPLESMAVAPQKARQVARQRLKERVNSASKQLLAELGMKAQGFQLPKLYPGTGTFNNLPAAIVLLNMEVCEFLNIGSNERDLLDTDQLRRAHDHMDALIDKIAKNVRNKIGGSDGKI